MPSVCIYNVSVSQRNFLASRNTAFDKSLCGVAAAMSSAGSYSYSYSEYGSSDYSDHDTKVVTPPRIQGPPQLQGVESATHTQDVSDKTEAEKHNAALMQRWTPPTEFPTLLGQEAKIRLSSIAGQSATTMMKDLAAQFGVEGKKADDSDTEGSDAKKVLTKEEADRAALIKDLKDISSKCRCATTNKVYQRMLAAFSKEERVAYDLIKTNNPGKSTKLQEAYRLQWCESRLTVETKLMEQNKTLSKSNKTVGRWYPFGVIV